jgi:hypothetical protein
MPRVRRTVQGVRRLRMRAVAPIVNLDQGLDPLRGWFNREIDHVRVIAIQSPT